jgi:hypothetical protein
VKKLGLIAAGLLGIAAWLHRSLVHQVVVDTAIGLAALAGLCVAAYLARALAGRRTAVPPARYRAVTQPAVPPASPRPRASRRNSRLGDRPVPGRRNGCPPAGQRPGEVRGHAEAGQRGQADGRVNDHLVHQAAVQPGRDAQQASGDKAQLLHRDLLAARRACPRS